jgi:hypothetical protein
MQSKISFCVIFLFKFSLTQFKSNGSIFGKENALSLAHLGFGSFGQAVSEKKIFYNRPIRSKNCLWWPCLLMDRDEMSNLYRGPSIDASYQVSSSFGAKVNLWKIVK